MKKQFLFLSLLVFVMFSSLAAESHAQVLDQLSDAPTGTNGWAIGDRNAQTVTVGIAGYLSKIEVQIFQSDEIAAGDLVVDIFGLTSRGAPDINALLGSVLIENSSVPTRTEMSDMFQYTAVDFSSQSLFFNAGDQFAIVPRRTELVNWGTTPWFVWGGAGNNSAYENGTFFLDGLTGWQQRGGAHGFRTFMTDEPGVPSMILGDCNQDGVTSFLDIAPFIGFLLSGNFLEEADINQSGEVTFLDLSPFIAILATK